MSSVTPSPLHWTLRFKHHKTTVILYTDPLHTFTQIKKDLLQTLRVVKPSGDFEGQKIPSDPEDVILGVPIDNYDLSRGWVSLEIPDADDVNGTAPKKPKQRAINPQAAGLKDGGVMAFRFKTGETRPAEDGPDIVEEAWDVTLPTYDEYGDVPDGQ